MLIVKYFTVGSYETNCYVVTDGRTLECAVIDPGADAAAILDYLEEHRLQCRFILLTHGHFDHVGAVPELMEETGAPLCMHRRDDGVTIGGEYYRFRAPEGTRFVSEGDAVSIGGLRFTVLETPGHTPGCVTWLCEDPESGESEKALFTGDTLFRDSCGRTDFPGGSAEDMLRSLKRLAMLPGDYEVYPGHMDVTSLDRERRVNPYIAMAMQQGEPT